MTNHRAIPLTREVAQKVLNTIDAGLTSGLGRPILGQMCVEAAVCYALGLPHNDDPGCVAELLRRLKIRLNDADWSSPRARANGLRRLGLAQLGSKGVLDEHEFAARVVRLTITKQLPAALRAAASVHGHAKHRIALDAAAANCENNASRSSCIEARHAAREAAREVTNAASAAACAAANAAEFGSISISATNTDQAANAAAFAADALARAAIEAEGEPDAARDKSLADFAEDVVQILIEMKSPGCEWLELTEAQSDVGGTSKRDCV